MKTELKTITPKEAQRIIDTCNIDNRRVRENNVKWLSDQMLRGEWLLTHQGIAFSDSGKLLDGQHRLLAVIKSNKPAQFMVTHGLDENAFKAIDCGERRSLADLTHIDKKTVEVLRLIASAISSADFNNNKATANQLLALEERGWGNLHRRYLKACPSHKPTNAACFRTAAVVSVALGQDEDYTFDLCQKIHLMRFDEMPPIAHSFVRQLSSSTINPTRFRVDAFLRFLKVLNPDFAKHKNLTLSDIERENLWALTKNILTTGIVE